MGREESSVGKLKTFSFSCAAPTSLSLMSRVGSMFLEGDMNKEQKKIGIKHEAMCTTEFIQIVSTGREVSVGKAKGFSPP
jgi:hypothetical protein